MEKKILKTQFLQRLCFSVYAVSKESNDRRKNKTERKKI